MISWTITILGLLGSWHYASFEAESFFQNTLAPILVAVFLISLLIKFIFLLGPDSSSGGNNGGSDGFYGGSSGGDGGCGGDGGGC